MPDPTLSQPNPDTFNRPMTTVANKETDARLAPINQSEPWWKSGTFRRWAAFLGFVALVIVNRKVGLGLELADLGFIAVGVVAVITGSNLKEAIGMAAEVRKALAGLGSSSAGGQAPGLPLGGLAGDLLGGLIGGPGNVPAPPGTKPEAPQG